MLDLAYANLHQTRSYHTLQLHHHGEDEKAHHLSAQKRPAFGLAFLNQVVVSWWFVKTSQQFLLLSQFVKGQTRVSDRTKLVDSGSLLQIKKTPYTGVFRGTLA